MYKHYVPLFVPLTPHTYVQTLCPVGTNFTRNFPKPTHWDKSRELIHYSRI
jgi:hypothetical protein